jgi:hypothetical protein
MIHVSNHLNGKRIVARGDKGEITVTIEIDEEGYPVVDICPMPANGSFTFVGFVNEKIQTTTLRLEDRENRQLFVSFQRTPTDTNQEVG